MAAKGQSLRPSQYITTFGSGSILETPDGPVVIAAPSHSGLFDENTQPDVYEIRDIRLSQTLLSNNKIFRIPSNADLGVNENKPLHNTYHFPRWSLCPSHGILYRYQPQSLSGCPQCHQQRPASKWGEVWAKSREEAVRFVLACSHGHLDEVPWRSLIKHRSDCSKPDYLRWQGGGGALRNIKITCPECNKSIEFGGPSGVYSKKFPCSGRFPEEDKRRVDCPRLAKIIQRGAANLRIPEIKSALTIPPLDTALHKLLQSRTVLDSLVGSVIPIDSKDMLVKLLDNLVKGKRLDRIIAATIKKYDEAELLSAMDDILDEINNPRNLTEATLRQDEFLSLRNAACDGAPPQRADKPGGPNQFEVYKENVERFRLDSGLTLRVTPLSRLRVVLVQVGYTRPIDTGTADENGQSTVVIVPVEYLPPNESIAWHPGVELFGEGIFLDFVSDAEPKGISEHFPLQGQAYDRWLAAYNSPDGYRKIKAMPGIDNNYLHPVFVWWHTLSHRLITALSVDSGYSSAAIRERVYTCTINNKAVGGLLLYTAQSGGDGTLGGLIGLVPHFKRISDSALRNLDACSNDPICIEEEFGEDKVNGSACYACQLISETSCEHRNTLLDRRLLLENKP